MWFASEERADPTSPAPSRSGEPPELTSGEALRVDWTPLDISRAYAVLLWTVLPTLDAKSEGPKAAHHAELRLEGLHVEVRWEAHGYQAEARERFPHPSLVEPGWLIEIHREGSEVLRIRVATDPGI